MYPPYSTQGKEFHLDKKLTVLPKLGISLNELKRRVSNNNSLKTPFKVPYKPSCEIEIYNKFSSDIRTKRFMENYLRKVPYASNALDVLKLQKELLYKTKFIDSIFNDVLYNNLLKKRTFFDSLNKRGLCSENQ
jgi:hypothetical protein